MIESDLITCIFCLRKQPPSDEHVVPKSLGGNLIIRCVCGECNTSLSHLDQSLADSSMLTLPRLFEQPDAVWGQSAQLAADRAGGENLELKVGHKLKSEMKAQLIFKRQETGIYQVTGNGDDAAQYKEFFRVLRKQIAKVGLKKFKILSPANNTEGAEPGFRLVLNRSNEVVFRPSNKRANAEAELTALVGILEKKLDVLEREILEAASKPTSRRRTEQPNVIFNMQPDFGRNLRAVSKIAFTFLASTYGCESVLGSNFDALRRYILTGDGADDPGSLWWNGDEKEKSLGSSRYAAWQTNYKELPFAFGHAGVHTIFLHAQNDRHFVITEFYGQCAYHIDAGNLGPRAECPLVHEFDYVNRTNRKLSPQEILQRLHSNKNPK